jgi:hypothetical protein
MPITFSHLRVAFCFAQPVSVGGSTLRIVGLSLASLPTSSPWTILREPNMLEKQSAGIGKGTPGPGRKKGVPNKDTALIRDMIATALTQVGGVEYLARVAESHPGPFLSLVGKVLPIQLTGEGGGPVRFEKIVRTIVTPDART